MIPSTVNAIMTVNTQAKARGLAALALAALLAALVLAAPVAQAETRRPAPVGEVSLVLGKAWVQGAEDDRQRKAVRVGTTVGAHDQIITEANGHVHIRFIDDALVSVRPDSRLEITEYAYNAARPERSMVNFRLIEGVTRSISGEAGRSARERFRLDTPIAAIGVRGTDFVVSANERNVRALVNEGAIVMTPYSELCVVGTLGPCDVGGVELASASMQIIEVAQGQVQPVLHPRPEQELHDLIASELEEREQSESDAAKEEAADVYQESASARQLNASTASLTTISLSAEHLTERQLAWGRWATGWADDGSTAADGISLAYRRAREGREITVGNNRHGLFRTESEAQRVEGVPGEIGFDLTAAQAFHHGADGVQPMSIDGGDLRIDFGSNTFSTELRMHSDATGTVDFRSSGSIFSSGFFHNRSADKNIGGATSLDGREAGYFFDERIGSGQIRGTTLWDAQ